jgi:hypothetical protein
VKSDDARRPAFSLRDRLEAEFLLQFASKLKPDEVLEAHYVDTGTSNGYKVGFAGMYATEFVVDRVLSENRIGVLLDVFRSTRRHQAAFARDLAVATREPGRVIALDFIGGCIAALLFEEAHKRKRAVALDDLAQMTQDMGGYPELDKEPSR